MTTVCYDTDTLTLVCLFVLLMVTLSVDDLLKINMFCLLSNPKMSNKVVKAKKLKLLTLMTCAAQLIELKRKMETKKRRIWSEPWLLRRNEGRGVLNMLQHELRVEDPDSYKLFLRMCHEHFEELLSLVENDIKRRDTNMRESISAEMRLALTLRFLATGETYRSLMFSTRIHESTIGLIIPNVCRILYENLRNVYLKTPSTTNEWLQVSADFENLWNFPMCLGAIDGKHINFRPPRSSGSFYYNYKGNHSIVLLAVCDAKYRFTYVDIGVNGRISDGGVYRESSFKQAVDLNTLKFPDNSSLPNQNERIPYVFVADDAFPLNERILKPYPNRGLTIEKRIFNYRLSRARRVIENSFGIMSNRFRILLTTINLAPNKVEDITLACCVLHNFLLTKNPSEYADGDFEKIVNLTSLGNRQSGNRNGEGPTRTRNLFTNYFNSHEGAVAWQNESINL